MGPILRKYDPWSQDQGLQVFAEVVLTAVKTTWQKHLFASFCRQKWQKLKKRDKFSLLSSQNILFSNKSKQKHVILKKLHVFGKYVFALPRRPANMSLPFHGQE